MDRDAVITTPDGVVALFCECGRHPHWGHAAKPIAPAPIAPAPASASSVPAEPPSLRDANGDVDGGAGAVFGEVGDPGSSAQTCHEAGGEPGLVKERPASIGPEPSVPMCDTRLPEPVAEIIAGLQMEAERVKAHAESFHENHPSRDWYDGYAFGVAQSLHTVEMLTTAQAAMRNALGLPV